MQWSDQAIILQVRKFAEHGAVVTLFSRANGLYSGVCKAAQSKAQRGIYQPGNIVQANWKARLEEHIGSLSCELDMPVAALVMQDARALSGLNAVCAMLPLAVHERDAHPQLYDAAVMLLEHLASGQPWLVDYIRFELCLMREAGYGLDLEQCAATGARDSLVYVSPKSGCAVSASAGAPYHERMLPLPAFLLQEQPEVQHSAIADGFKLTSYFLTHWLLAPLGRSMPDARERVLRMAEAAV